MTIEKILKITNIYTEIIIEKLGNDTPLEKGLTFQLIRESKNLDKTVICISSSKNTIILTIA